MCLVAAEEIRSRHVAEGPAEVILPHACCAGLEGIVSKRRHSSYSSGRSKEAETRVAQAVKALPACGEVRGISLSRAEVASTHRWEVTATARGSERMAPRECWEKARLALYDIQQQ